MGSNNPELTRVENSPNNKTWKRWGPYLAERQWGTVREDYSKDGSAWDYMPHELARSNAYRFGEEGLGGFCDHRQIMCIAPAFWNGKDKLLKERLFGLTNSQGNHGEDVKELYYHLDSTPTHSYCKMLYKYPIQEFPYTDLVHENGRRGREDREYELMDTGVFDKDEYFDIYIEYAKGGTEDIVIKITAHNRSKKAAPLWIIPQLWFRNYWKHNKSYQRAKINSHSDTCIEAFSRRVGQYYLYHKSGKQVFCENETNNKLVYGGANNWDYVKDGINDFVIHKKPTVNPELFGTKAGVIFHEEVKAGGEMVVELRFTNQLLANPWNSYDTILESRKSEADIYFNELFGGDSKDEQYQIMRQAFAGLMWGKQWYYYDVHKWLNGEPGQEVPSRDFKRNNNWQHLTNRNVLSMPDKWEYPWYAAWDLAFHTTSLVHVDPYFAKRQLALMLREYYMHPNGQIPAYEWNFSDVNPPVHAWACWEVYETDKKKNGVGDLDFLERVFQKLLMNFTWWVNQKDKSGRNLFEGGFLGLDNIGVFDRNHLPDGVKSLDQADATAWMAMYCLNMLRMSVELANKIPAYEESASKFFRHFLDIAWSLSHLGDNDDSLWDEEDSFFYDVVRLEDGSSRPLKVRSLVGLLPMLAVEVVGSELFDELYDFKRRSVGLMKSRPDLAELISRVEKFGKGDTHLFSLLRGYRLEKIIARLLDEDEFLSDYGIRSLSKFHEKNPYTFEHRGQHHYIEYTPGESRTGMFGGNSNWRGPIWFPMNYILIRSIRKYYEYYGDKYKYECPTGSGNLMDLSEIADELTRRLIKLFKKGEDGKYVYYAENEKYAKDPNFSDHHQFFEFFHGDTGEGLGAAHQTGWTALVANLVLDMQGKENL